MLHFVSLLQSQRASVVSFFRASQLTLMTQYARSIIYLINGNRSCVHMHLFVRHRDSLGRLTI